MESLSRRMRRRHVRDAGCQGFAMGVVVCGLLSACSGQTAGTVSAGAGVQPVVPALVSRANAGEGEAAPVVQYAVGDVRDMSAYQALASSAQPAPAKTAAGEGFIERELGTASDGGYQAYSQ